MADINQIVDKKVIDTLKQMNDELVKAGQNIDKLIPPLNGLNEAQKNITKTTKDQTEQEKQLITQQREAEAINKQILATEAKINALNSESSKILAEQKLKLQQATQAQKDKIKAEQAAEGSLVRMRQKLKELTAEYDKSGIRTKAAAKEINDLSREIGKAEAATNRHQRGVGGYADQLGTLGDKVSALPGPLGSMTSGIMSAGKAMWALVANPVGAVIAALVVTVTSLYKIFKSTDEGATTFAAVLKAMGNIVDVVIDRMVSFYKMLWDIVTFDFKGVKENAQDAFGGVGDAIRDAAKAGWEYEQVMDRINDTEAASLTRAAKLKKEIEELTVASKNRNLGTKEQIRLAELAMQKEKELSEIEVGFSKQKTTATLNDLSSKISNDKLSISSKQKMLEMWLNIDDKQLQSQLKKDKAFAEFYNKNEKDFQALQKMRAEDIDKETELVTGTRRLQTSLFTFKKELFDEDQRRKNEASAAEKKLSEERAKMWADEVWAKQQQKNEELKIQQKFEEEFAKLIEDETIKDDEFQTKAIENTIKYGEEQLALKQKFAEEEDKIDAENVEKQKQRRQELQDAIFNGAEQLGNILFDMKNNQLRREFEAAEGNTKKQNELKRKMAQAEKRQALFNVAINTASGIMKAIQQTGLPAALPFVILTGLIGAAQAAAIASQKVPAFAKGTEFAPGGLSLVGEKGRELIQSPDGNVFLANNPALVNLQRGSKVLTNQKTEAYLNDRNIVSELRYGLKSVENAINRKPIAITDNSGRIVGRQSNNYRETYLNRLQNGR